MTGEGECGGDMAGEGETLLVRGRHDWRVGVWGRHDW